MIAIEPRRFEQMIVEALDGLPPRFGEAMQNIAVVVDHDSPPSDILGLYEGVPLTERLSDFAGVLPDVITIYRQSICAYCRDETDVIEEVRRTVIHEVGHHFGIDDDRLHELGW